MIPKNSIKVKMNDNWYQIANFYRAIYNAYKGNVGKKTASGNEITEKMLETIKKRMIELMAQSH